MVRLTELADVYFCRERQLIAAADNDALENLHAVGARMIERRETIAGAVKDLEGRS